MKIAISAGAHLHAPDAFPVRPPSAGSSAVLDSPASMDSRPMLHYRGVNRISAPSSLFASVTKASWEHDTCRPWGVPPTNVCCPPARARLLAGPGHCSHSPLALRPCVPARAAVTNAAHHTAAQAGPRAELAGKCRGHRAAGGGARRAPVLRDVEGAHRPYGAPRPLPPVPMRAAHALSVCAHRKQVAHHRRPPPSMTSSRPWSSGSWTSAAVRRCVTGARGPSPGARTRRTRRTHLASRPKHVPARPNHIPSTVPRDRARAGL